MNNNKTLNQAKINLCDEFYTKREFIEKELNHYTEQFKNQVIYLNCDNPLKSKFWQYFYDNFEEFGLKKLISSHYCEQGSFSMSYDGKSEQVKILKNGSFNSLECLELLETADIVITNPPFSKFREFFKTIMFLQKRFLILGSIHMLSYKEAFTWYKMGLFNFGYNFNLNVKFDTPYYDKKEIALGGILWLTNLKIQNNSKELEFIDFDENLHKQYDNYEAININSIKEIPKDYKGKMGVPITFLKYHNPAEFKIIGADYELVKETRFYLNNKKIYARIVIQRVC